MLAALPAGLAVASGSLIGLVLGLIGGGGSILAVPLLVYAVGMASPHAAIGTAAVAVAVNAAASLGLHARRGKIRWPCAIVFSLAGIAGALAGAALGKAIDGQKLLAAFGLLMVLVGLMMLRPKPAAGHASPWLSRQTAPHLLPRLAGLGAGVGLLSGVFGIGGGFLIVPGLMLAARMPLAEAASASLVAVTAFGLASASSYAWSGLVDWPSRRAADGRRRRRRHRRHPAQHAPVAAQGCAGPRVRGLRHRRGSLCQRPRDDDAAGLTRQPFSRSMSAPQAASFSSSRS